MLINYSFCKEYIEISIYYLKKCILKQIVTPIWGTIGIFSPIFTKFTHFLSSSKYIIQRVYAIHRVKIHIVKIHGVKG